MTRTRVLVYNKTDNHLFAQLSGHGDKQELPSRQRWAEWRIREFDETFLLKIYEGSETVYRLDIRVWSGATSDKHITIYEKASGYYHKMEEPW